jgi:hypothetical protein
MSDRAFFRVECEDYTNMKWFMHPLLAIIAGATEPEMAKYIEYLKVENQILRDRLPKKIDTTEAERDKLLKAGKPFGAKIKQLISIVSPRTFPRWVQADCEARAAKKENKDAQQAEPTRHGNSKPEEVHELVLEIRKETGWGAGRIKGELYRHGYRTIARSTINRNLRYLIGNFVVYYHTKRSHRGPEYRTPDQVDRKEDGDPIESLKRSALVRRESLGGAVKWYERKAA